MDVWHITSMFCVSWSFESQFFRMNTCFVLKYVVLISMLRLLCQGRCFAIIFDASNVDAELSIIVFPSRRAIYTPSHHMDGDFASATAILDKMKNWVAFDQFLARHRTPISGAGSTSTNTAKLSAKSAATRNSQHRYRQLWHRRRRYTTLAPSREHAKAVREKAMRERHAEEEAKTRAAILEHKRTRRPNNKTRNSGVAEENGAVTTPQREHGQSSNTRSTDPRNCAATDSDVGSAAETHEKAKDPAETNLPSSPVKFRIAPKRVLKGSHLLLKPADLNDDLSVLLGSQSQQKD
eukprot:m.212297 g.212297  ORF g.212297 m.212297 type:complete len:294 (-) comp19038_c0_seq2:451-1332(-)